MAKVFTDLNRIVPTWLEAARYLDTQPKREAMNLVLEISDPMRLEEEEKGKIKQVNSALAHKNISVQTVAGTIFPTALYRRHGRPDFYDAYKEMIKRGKKPYTWGTYFQRMTEHPGRKKNGIINPLDMLVEKLSPRKQPKNGKTSYTSSYELGIADPSIDLSTHESLDEGGEIPTYDVARDGNQWYGFPCLSHVSFKRVPTNVDDEYVINLTAVYRRHMYCERALGNLIGLAQLMSFVANETGLKVGTLTCLSTHATLDVSVWGGVGAAREILHKA